MSVNALCVRVRTVCARERTRVRVYASTCVHTWWEEAVAGKGREGENSPVITDTGILL